MNTKLIKKDKNDFEKDFFTLNNTVFENNLENVRNHRDINLIKKYKKRRRKKRNKFVSEPNYHTTKCFLEKLVAIKMKK